MIEWQEVKLEDISNIATGSSNSIDAVDDGKYPLYDRSSKVKKSNKFLFDTFAKV